MKASTYFTVRLCLWNRERIAWNEVVVDVGVDVDDTDDCSKWWCWRWRKLSSWRTREGLHGFMNDSSDNSNQPLKWNTCHKYPVHRVAQIRFRIVHYRYPFGTGSFPFACGKIYLMSLSLCWYAEFQHNFCAREKKKAPKKSLTGKNFQQWIHIWENGCSYQLTKTTAKYKIMVMPMCTLFMW